MQDGPLTVLQLTHQGEGAGSTQSIFSLSLHLKTRGHRVLVGCRPETLLAGMAREAGLEVVPLDFRRLRPLAGALRRTITEQHVEVVNSHATRDRRVLTWLRWRGALPQPFVVTRRTMPLTSPAEIVAVGLSADRTIAVSHAVARALRRRLHPAARLRVVHNGIDLARIDRVPTDAELAAARAALGDFGSRPLVVVMSRRKDQHVLLAQLGDVQRPVAVAFVGIEPDAELRALEARLPDRHRVIYVPFTAQPLAFYHVAAVAALPSRIEGFSQALLEAMTLGLPVVASAAGGNAELITDGATGLLVPLDAPTVWGRALDSLLGDSDLRSRLARAGRELVRREYTLERTAARTEEVYREAIAHRARAEGVR
ncbi:MAG: glycosyltransferase family 4 protein [Gemmatimonadetes bacterium]|nr:glycosyltransferase family 4 protein [Gemmatimonadota bacterium]